MNRPLSAGFTLLEITVVLLILGILLAGMLGPLATQIEARDRRQTQGLLDDIQQALYGYALTHGRLPCPDTDGDGWSNPRWEATDPSTAECTRGTGGLPWSELAVAAGDAWGNRYTYAVSFPDFTRPDTDDLCNGGDAVGPHFDLCSRGNLTVKSRGDLPGTAGQVESKSELATYATGVPAVVVSHGRNGHGAASANGSWRAPPDGGDELENADADRVFMSRMYSAGAAACVDDANEASALCEFDDMVIWLSPMVLNARMVAAGRLP